MRSSHSFFNFLLILLTISFFSCTVYNKRCKNYHKEFSVICNCKNINSNDSIANEIKKYTNDNCDGCYYYYCPILFNKKNKVGIYQYWKMATHNHSNNFFLYDSEKITYIKSNNFETIKSFLQKNNFSNKQIEKTISKIKECNEKNKNTGDRF